MECFPFCPSTPPSLALICLLRVQIILHALLLNMYFACNGLNVLTIILNSNMFQALGRNMITGASDIAGTPVIKNKRDSHNQLLTVAIKMLKSRADDLQLLTAINRYPRHNLLLCCTKQLLNNGI